MTTNDKQTASIEKITAKFIEGLEGDFKYTIPWKRLYNRPYCFTTNKEYTGWNLIMLLWFGGHDDPRWATYKQWQEKGFQVKGGEKGFVLSRPLMKNGEKENSNGEKEKFQYMYGLMPFTVFNIAQTDCEIPLDLGEQLEFVPEEKAEEILKFWPCQYGAMGASYSPSNDIIALPNIGDFKTTSRYYTTRFHETIHATGHSTRLNRNFDNINNKASYSFEELIAVLGSALLAAHCQIDFDEGYIDYVKGYLSHLDNDHMQIVKAGSKAMAAYDYILNNPMHPQN